MNAEGTQLGLSVQLHVSLEDAQELVAEALKAEGFGVLTEIDVKQTLKNKLDVDFRPYKILGACNPVLAHKALSSAPEVGLLLPCNVTLSEGENGATLVSLINPMMMLGIISNPDITPIAEEATERLERVAAALEGK